MDSVSAAQSLLELSANLRKVRQTKEQTQEVAGEINVYDGNIRHHQDFDAHSTHSFDDAPMNRENLADHSPRSCRSSEQTHINSTHAARKASLKERSFTREKLHAIAGLEVQRYGPYINSHAKLNSRSMDLDTRSKDVLRCATDQYFGIGDTAAVSNVEDSRSEFSIPRSTSESKTLSQHSTCNEIEPMVDSGQQTDGNTQEVFTRTFYESTQSIRDQRASEGSLPRINHGSSTSISESSQHNSEVAVNGTHVHSGSFALQRDQRMSTDSEGSISGPYKKILFMCDWHGCTQSFTAAGQLEDHYYSHTGLKPFICAQDGCDGAFASAQLLAHHSRSTNHGMVISWNKQRVSQNALGIRRSQYTPGDLDCTWKGCGAAFDTALKLSQHHQQHLRDSLFQCVCTWEDCSAVFSHNYELMDHYNTHLEESELEYEQIAGNEYLEGSIMQEYYCDSAR